MKLDNRNLALKGLLEILPPRLERYTRSVLGERTSPEELRRLLTADGTAPEVPDPDLADLSTQIRILTARDVDGRLPPPPQGLTAALEEVQLFRDEAVRADSLSADRVLAALDAVGETLRIIGAESGHAELRGLIRAVDGGRGPRRDPLDAVRVKVGGELERIGVVSYAHAVAGVRPAVSIRLSRDRASSDPRPIEVVLTIIEDDGMHEITEPWRLTWRASAPELNETRALVLDRAALLQVARPGSTHVRIELRGDDGATTVRRFPGPTVLPPRQWRLAGGERWAGAALATFVQPGQDAVEALVSEALGLVGEGAGRVGDSGAGENAGRDAGGDAAWLDALVAAACAALRRRRPQIEAVGSAWDRGPHSVRTGAELLSARTGTTLDVVVLLAGALERLGVPAVLLLTPKTALLGYWRNEEDAERIPASPQEAAELARDGTLGLVYPELALRRSAAALHELTGRVRALALKDLSDLVLAVPIRTARGRGASPQPLLELDEDGDVVELPAPDADVCRPIAAAPPSDARWPAVGAPDAPTPPAIEEWKRSLLDLSLRNPLIDCTPRNAVELLVPSTLIGRFEDIINSRELVTLVSRGAGPRTPGGSKSRTAMLTEERIVGVDLAARDYQRRLPALAASARTTLEETGANNLYLAVGSLVWRTDGRRLHSPLILIPVTLVREGDGDAYVVGLDEAGASTPNRSLLARYEADTGVDLVELREPVRDEHGVDVEATLAALRARIESSGRDDAVEASVHLGLFRFSTYRMWRDLEDDWRTIVENPLVAHLLGDPSAPFADPAGVAPSAPVAIDEVVENLPLKADAAQARVVADAVEGRSLVVEGPPGTGKSQTVANLVFRALATGRTVMFVAEKASALDVVARRLREEAGIGDLLLNLHDNGMKPSEVRRALRRALELRAPGQDAAAAAGLRERLTGLRERLAGLRERLGAYREGLHAPGAEGPSYYEARQALVGAREGDPAELERAREVFEARARDTGLDAFGPSLHAGLLRDYRDALGRLRTELTGELLDVVLARRDRVLDVAGARAQKLRHELDRRKGSDIRKIMDDYGDLVTAITPCILVSPDSVARFFPAHRRYVDIVVFDEASQITVPDAVGAMGRGRSTVVVGDIRQMPPAVPSGAGGDLEGARGGERDSILDRCLDAGVTRHLLTWHYRSRVESLIAFSNKHYYHGALLSFPSPLALTGPDDGPGGHGISLRRVNGRYYGARARTRHPGIQTNTNPVEARQIVNEVLRRFEASPDSVPSIGVVTFNARQRDLIETELRETGSKRILEALETRDGLFVRNLENVQGEERDTILFSLTFSVNERGDMPLSFGSLGHAGGHHRFNVAITRARRQIVVFSSFDPEDLHAERSSHRGLKDLRAYLEQARARRSPRALPASRSPVDLHRNEIAEALRDAGLEVKVGVGRSAFEIDLVLTAPERPDRADREDREDRPGERAVAVLLDGPGWNRRRSVMDRDLLPVDVLADMGWRHVERVWMPEWVAAPDAVVARLVAAAGGEPVRRPRPEPSAAAAPPAPTGTAAEALGTVASGATRAPGADTSPGSASAGGADPTAERDASDGPADYHSWSPEGVHPRDVLDRAETDPGARAEVIEMARAICDVEAPLTRHRLIVKICRAFGLSRTAASREERIRKVLGGSFAYIDEHDFVWRTYDASLLPVSYRRGALDHVDSIEEIHPRELVALMTEVRANHPECSSTELCTKALARLSARRRRLSARGVLTALTAALREVEAGDEA